MSFTRLTIAKKLGFFVVTMILLIVMTTAVSFYSFGKISRSYIEVETKAVPDIMAIFRIRMASDRLLSEIKGFVASGDKSEIAEFNSTLTELRELYNEYEVTQGDNEEEKIRQKLWSQKEQIAGIADDIFSQYEQRAGLLEELENVEEALEIFYVVNRAKFTSEERGIFDEIVLATKSLQSE